MFRYSLLLSIMLVTMGQVAIPVECITIANREGYGEILKDKKEVVKAKARLVYLRARHPFDKEIRACDKVVNELASKLLVK